MRPCFKTAVGTVVEVGGLPEKGQINLLKVRKVPCSRILVWLPSGVQTLEKPVGRKGVMGVRGG